MTGEKECVRELTAWYRTVYRPLPWRESRDPYHIWISEIMLQQTRIEAVLGYYAGFVERFPDIRTLAAASEEAVLKQWEGLGYYSRARNLHKAAKQICTEYGGTFPADYEQIRKLPGVGEYTAGAIGAIAFGLPVTAIDGNVMRVVSRIYGLEEDILLTSSRKNVKTILESVYPAEEASDFVQGLMELGERICVPGSPRCEGCPVCGVCQAFCEGRQEELPVRKKKGGQRVQPRQVLLIEREGKVLLHRRPKEGVLGGLWEYPGVDGSAEEDVAAGFSKQWGLELGQVVPMMRTHHVFTHIRWEMAVYTATLRSEPVGEDFVWASREEIREKYMIPTAFKKITEALDRGPDGASEGEEKDV